MSEFGDRMKEDLEGLRAARDELRVQLHLASAELKDDWESLERGWSHLEARMKVLGHETGEVRSEIGETLHVLADQLRSGYARIKTLL